MNKYEQLIEYIINDQEDKARELFPKLDQKKIIEDFMASAAWLKSRADATGKM